MNNLGAYVGALVMRIKTAIVQYQFRSTFLRVELAIKYSFNHDERTTLLSPRSSIKFLGPGWLSLNQATTGVLYTLHISTGYFGGL